MNHMPASGAASLGLDVQGVGRALGRALVSQFQGPMLLALCLPFVVALLGAVVLTWLFWTPLTGWLQGELFSLPLVDRLDSTLVNIGIASLKLWLVPLAATVILLPISGLLGLVVAAVLIMPLVLRHLEQRDYPDVARRGGRAFIASLWNALWVGTLFVAGWVLTMPMWLLPPLGVLLHIWWWTFAFTRMLGFDSLADHASREERKLLRRRHRVGYWALGLVCAVINFLPPAWLLLPVFSALVFSHFSLEALRRLRSERHEPS